MSESPAEQQGTGPRIVKVRLSPGLLASLLGVPEGGRIVGVRTDIDPVRAEVLVSHPAFPPLPDPDHESPYVPATGRLITDGRRKGRVDYEWDWPVGQ